MSARYLFAQDFPVAARQAKTDRQILARYLREAGADMRLDEAQLRAAHAILVKWAQMETSGRLANLSETQLQGDFLAQVWGDALGYPGPADGLELWHRLQHHVIAGETPDAVLGDFREHESPQPLAVIELKGPLVHLDRDRSRGRTAVDQCWDYLVNTPAMCRRPAACPYICKRHGRRNASMGLIYSPLSRHHHVVIHAPTEDSDG